MTKSHASPGWYRAGQFLGRRIVAWIEIGALLSGAAALVSLTASHWWFADLLAQFRLQWATALGGGVILFLVRRRWITASVVSVLFLWQSVPLGVYALVPSPETKETGDSPEGEIRLVSFNVLSANPRHGEVGAYLLASDADVVGLLEVTPSWVRNLEGIAARWPHRYESPRSDNFGLALWSRIPVRESTWIRHEPGSIPSLLVRFAPRSGAPFQLILTHPVPPVGREATVWRDDQLRSLARVIGSTDSPPWILAGDFNLTPWSPRFREALREGRLLDPARGRGIRATWHRFPTIWGGLPIDHTLHTSGITPLDHEIGPSLGSDHRPVVFTFGVSAMSREEEVNRTTSIRQEE